MLEPQIVFGTLNLNQSHFDPHSDSNSPDLCHRTPFRNAYDLHASAFSCGTDGRRTGCKSLTELVTFDIHLTPWRGTLPPDPESVARSLTLVSTVSNHPLVMDSLSRFLPIDFGHFMREHSH